MPKPPMSNRIRREQLLRAIMTVEHLIKDRPTQALKQALGRMRCEYRLMEDEIDV